MQSKQSSLQTKILCCVIFLTNITQMPQLLDSGYNSMITLLCWGLFGSYLLVTKKTKIGRINLVAVICLISTLFFSITVGTITGTDYFHTALMYPFALSVFVFLMGSLCDPYQSQISMKPIYLIYVVSGTIVGIAVYYDSFASGFSWTSRSYAYASKNSVAQIILTVVILLVFIKLESTFQNIVRIAVLVLMILLLLMLKSRASLLGLCVIILAIMLNKNIKWRYKILTIVTLGILIYVVLTTAEVYDIVVDGIILAGRKSGDINDISSGRYDMIGEFWRLFKDNWLLGMGIYYLESFPLSALCQYGIIGALPIVIFLLFPFSLLKRMGKTENRPVLVVILVCYYINGLFEELAPLGPGVKCYFLWFLLGLESNQYKLTGTYKNAKCKN